MNVVSGHVTCADTRPFRTGFLVFNRYPALMAIAPKRLKVHIKKTALIVAWIQLGEVPTIAEGAGMTLIVIALAWLSIVGWRRFSRRASGV